MQAPATNINTSRVTQLPNVVSSYMLVADLGSALVPMRQLDCNGCVPVDLFRSAGKDSNTPHEICHLVHRVGIQDFFCHWLWFSSGECIRGQPYDDENSCKYVIEQSHLLHCLPLARY